MSRFALLLIILSSLFTLSSRSAKAAVSWSEVWRDDFTFLQFPNPDRPCATPQGYGWNCDPSNQSFIADTIIRDAGTYVYTHDAGQARRDIGYLWNSVQSKSYCLGRFSCSPFRIDVELQWREPARTYSSAFQIMNDYGTTYVYARVYLSGGKVRMHLKAGVQSFYIVQDDPNNIPPFQSVPSSWFFQSHTLRIDKVDNLMEMSLDGNLIRSAQEQYYWPVFMSWGASNAVGSNVYWGAMRSNYVAFSTGTTGCNTSFPNNQMHGCYYEFSLPGSGPPADPFNAGNYRNELTDTPSGSYLVNHDWGGGGPFGQGDDFGLVWRGNINFSGTQVRFTTQSDDGTKIYLDGTLIDPPGTSFWYDHGPESRTSNWINITSGYHQVMYEFYENGGGAVSKLSYETNYSPNAPSALLTNGQTNPSGLVGSPYFSAIYNDPDPSDIANGYQIQVDDNSDFSPLHWDSGLQNMSNCSQGTRCQNITYAGPTLNSGVTYYWRISYRDNASSTGPFSTQTAYFVMENSGSLRGTVWMDYDGDCVKETGESNYTAGTTLWLKQSGVIKYTFSSNSNATGYNFALSGVLVGTYDLVVAVPSGYRATTAIQVPVTINPGATTEVGEMCL